MSFAVLSLTAVGGAYACWLHALRSLSCLGSVSVDFDLDTCWCHLWVSHSPLQALALQSPALLLLLEDLYANALGSALHEVQVCSCVVRCVWCVIVCCVRTLLSSVMYGGEQ